MADERTPTSVGELLDRIEHVAHHEQPVSLGGILDEIGHRSFGPMLLVPGLVMLAPVIGDIPGVPVLMGLVVILTAGQLLFRRDHIWLPAWLLDRSVSPAKVRKTLKWTRPVARFTDRWTRRRLPGLVGARGALVVAVSCVAVALTTPALELVPFSANFAGLAITLFGLALIAHDGLLGLIALGFTAVTGGVLLYGLL